MPSSQPEAVYSSRSTFLYRLERIKDNDRPGFKRSGYASVLFVILPVLELYYGDKKSAK